MNLDIRGFMLESLQLAKGGKRNQLSKWKVMRCHKLPCSMIGRFESFHLSLNFSSFVFHLACKFILIQLCFECKAFLKGLC